MNLGKVRYRKYQANPNEKPTFKPALLLSFRGHIEEVEIDSEFTSAQNAVDYGFLHYQEEQDKYNARKQEELDKALAAKREEQKAAQVSVDEAVLTTAQVAA